MTTRVRAGFGGVVVALVASLVTAVVPAAAQTDLDGVRIAADTVYRVLPDEGVVEVEIDYEVTNEIPNRREGLQIIQTFLTSIPGAYPASAIDLRAIRDNGDALTMTPSDALVWDIDLGPNLFYQQTRRFTVSYRLPDGPPRSADTWARVNPAYASFPVIARGDSGRSSVRVDFPPGFQVESFGSSLQRRSAFGGVVLSADAIAEPLEFFALLVGSSEFGLDSRTVEVDGVDGALVISSWPGDEEWDRFVEQGLVEGIPFLIDQIGVDWPVDGELEVIETVAPALAGYGGWFYEPGGSDGSDAAIDVGEELLLDLLGHEIAHAWFNDDFSGMRWLNEGLAEHFGVRFAEALDDSEVTEFETVTPRSDGAVDLIDWREPVFRADGEPDPTERFGYAASYQVISAIADEIGDEALEATLVSLFAVENPYRDSLLDPGPERVDWRDLLDAFQLVGGSESAEALFVTWVLGPDEEAELAVRADAQDAAAGLEGRDPGWKVPDVVPRLLADWDFDDLHDVVAEISAILVDAQALVVDAASRSVVLPRGPQTDFEAVATRSVGFDAVREGLAEQRDALDRLLAAYGRAAEPTGFFENVGLHGKNVDALVADAHAAFESGDLAGAARLADEVDRHLDDAEALGQQRVAVIVGAVLMLLSVALLSVVFVRRRTGRRSHGSVSPAD